MAREQRLLNLERETQLSFFASQLPAARLQLNLNPIKRDQKDGDCRCSSERQAPGGERRALHQSAPKKQQQPRAHQKPDQINLVTALYREPLPRLLNGVSDFQLEHS